MHLNGVVFKTGKVVADGHAEKVVEGVSKVLKNRPRKEVATVATFSGPVEKANANPLEVIVKLIQNAFFEAILPGFDRKVVDLGRGGHRADEP